MAQGTPVEPLSKPEAPGQPVLHAGDRQLTVTWSPVNGATEYEVWYHTSDDSNTAIQFTNDSNKTDTTCIITSLNNGTRYYVWVKAKNSAGTSEFSPVAQGTPVEPVSKPEAPGQPVLQAGDRQLTATWSPVAKATSYQVWYHTSDNSNAAIEFSDDTDKTDTTCVITGLTNGTTYYVWLKAINSEGTSNFSPSANGKPADPNIIYVPADCQSIQAAVDKAKSGNTIIVSPGRYQENIVITKQIILQSSDPTRPQDTIIDAGANGKDGIHIFLGTDVTIKGFTITNVLADNISYANAISVFQSSVTIDRNIIENNKVASAGVHINDNGHTLIITNNTIRNNERYNVTANGGSGIYVQFGNCTIKNNIISGNKSEHGGGIWVNGGNATIQDNVISNNQAYSGGGINTGSNSFVEIKGNTITGNNCTSTGGGLSIFQSTVKVFDNTISNNTAGNTGGGIDVSWQGIIHDRNGIEWPKVNQNGLDGLYQENTFSNNQPDDICF
ncbi:MAG: fibronectin type III domain-containing protein [Bacteroidota bacterium]